MINKEFCFEEEIRDGYLVTERVKKIWYTEINLLIAFDRMCKEYNLKYSVCYGTLLGAIRHKGFIPWDDDIDVFMMRDDYNKMLKIAPNYFKEPYFFQSAYTDVMVWGFSKLRDSRTTAIEFDDMKEQFNQGIFIDIFPLDSTDDGSAKMKTVTNIKKDKALLISGIASPQPFIQYIQNFVSKTESLCFPDHHSFSAKDIEKIRNRALKMKNGNTLPHIIVTEKDAARLIYNPHLTNEIKQNLYYLPLKICFLQDQGTTFDAQIKDVITKNRKNYIPKTIKTS